MGQESFADEEQLAIHAALRVRGIWREQGSAPHPEVLPKIALTALHEAVIETYLEWERQKRIPPSRRRQGKGDRFKLVDHALTHFPDADIPEETTVKELGKWHSETQAMIRACGYYVGSLAPPGTINHPERIIQVMDIIEGRICYRVGQRFFYERDKDPDRLSLRSWRCLAARATEVVKDHSLFLKIVYLADYNQRRAFPPAAVGSFRMEDVEQAEHEARVLLMRRLGGAALCEPNSYPPSRELR